MLESELVEKIAFGEKDPLVASFWKTAFYDTKWLQKEIKGISVTVETWKLFKEGNFRTDRERALACLFLNRTSFSGIIAESAGPIGGFQQKSEYKINCRFNVEMLTKRLDKIASFGDKVKFIENITWEETFEKALAVGHKSKDLFFYLDPPFYKKADKLYRYFFEDNDHQQLRDEILKIKQPWLLSYDPAKEIVDKYANCGKKVERITHMYSTGKKKELPEIEELIITNLNKLPKEANLWRKSTE